MPPPPPGGTIWIDYVRDAKAAPWFLAAYETAMAPRRKAAAAMLTADLGQDFTIETGMDSEEAAAACAGVYQASANEPVGIFMSREVTAPPDAAFLARPGLTAVEAAYWVETTCRYLHDRTAKKRRSLAREAGHVDEVFSGGLGFAVPSSRGELITVDPAKLVEGASTDGLQVAFGPGLRVSITPFGRTGPGLSGRLQRVTRRDDREMLEVVGLPSMGDLDGPLGTIACAAMQVREVRGRERVRIFDAEMAAIFYNCFVLSAFIADEARQDMIEADECAAPASPRWRSLRRRRRPSCRIAWRRPFAP